MTDWPNYLIRSDFTKYADRLEAIPLGVVDENSARTLASVLAEYGSEEDRSKWNLTEGVTEFSLYGAVVSINGLNSRSYPTFSFYRYTLAVDFPEASTAPVGRLHLCWNDPVAEEPPVVEPMAEE